MLDSTQTILLIVIVLLTILLLVLGIQVFVVLRDAHKAIHKLNKILDDASGSISTLSSLKFLIPVVSLIGVLLFKREELFKGTLKEILKKLSSPQEKKVQREKQVVEVVKEANGEAKREQKPARRFFKGTKPL